MRKLLILLCTFFPIATIIAQQSVAIGDTQVKTNAVLYLKGNGTQGLIIPVVAATGGFGEEGMIVFNSTEKKLYYHTGSAWVEAGGAAAAEVDGVIGNEVKAVNTARGGLELSGAGTNASPLTVALTPGTVDGQILKWDNLNKKWVVSAGGTSYTEGTGIDITGSTITNTGDTNASDDITTATTATGDVSGTFPNLTVSRIRGVNVVATPPTSNQVLQYNGTNWAPANLPSGGVTSVGLTMPSIFSVTGSPITTSGTLATTLTSQTAATVFAAPTAAAGTPTFRTLAATDIPALDATKITTGTLPLTRIAGGGAGVKAILGSDNNTLSWVTGAPDQLLGTSATGVLGFTNKSAFTFTTANVIPKGSPGGLTASQIFDNGTNIGIGITTPAYLLDVSKATTAPDAQIRVYNPSNTTEDKSGIRFGVGSFWAVHLQTSLNGNWLELTDNSGGVVQAWNYDRYYPGNGIAYIQGTGGNLAIMGGRVGIGTTSPAQALDVNGSIRTNTGYYYFSDATFIAHIPGSYTIVNDHWIPNNNNTYDLGTSIYRWRNAYLNNNPSVSSDSRLKKDITTLTYGLPEVMKLKPVSYKLISDSEQKVKLGFIAQEVKEIIPEIITEDSSKEKYMAMSYSELIPVLINAIQEQQKIIDGLKTEVKSLRDTHDYETSLIKAELTEIKKILNLEASMNKN